MYETDFLRKLNTTLCFLMEFWWKHIDKKLSWFSFSKFYFQFFPLQVRTLFVSGLPMDAKPRELYLLFRAYEGYEGSLLKVTSKNGKTASVSWCKSQLIYRKCNLSSFLSSQPVGFVTFNTRAGAEAAKQDLQVSS